MFIIAKEFHFSASHVLQGLKEGHPCGRLHGHNYVVIVTLFAPDLDKNGFVVDYNEFKPFKDYIDDKVDHRHLNDLWPFQPSAEKMAEYFYNKVQEEIPVLKQYIHSVTVKETPKTAATYEPYNQ